MLRLLRLMFPYMLLVCLAAVFIGMLNARGHFFVPAMGATMLNVVMIASRASGSRRDLGRKNVGRADFRAGHRRAGRRAWPRRPFNCRRSAREGFRYAGSRRGATKRCGASSRKMIPGTIGVAAFQINVLLTQSCRVLVRPAHRRLVQLRGAADGIAAGNVRHFARHLSAADAVRPGGGKKLSPNSARRCGRASALCLFVEPDRLRLAAWCWPCRSCGCSSSAESSRPIPRSAWRSRWSAWRRAW